MKRVLCVLHLALIVPLLLIPASASEEYVFEWLNPEVMFLDYSFPLLEGCMFVFDGELPLGSYDISSVSSGVSISGCLHYDELIFLEDQYDLPFWGAECALTVVVDQMACDVLFCAFYIPDDGFTVIVPVGDLSFDGYVDFLVLTSVVPALSLVDYVSGDSIACVLDQVVALLPVVLAVLVGYIAVRKVFAWIQGFLHEV